MPFHPVRQKRFLVAQHSAAQRAENAPGLTLPAGKRGNRVVWQREGFRPPICQAPFCVFDQTRQIWIAFELLVIHARPDPSAAQSVHAATQPSVLPRS